MSATLTLKPVYPVPGKPFVAIFNASAGNFVRVFVTSAPLGSEWDLRLKQSTAGQIQILATDSGVAQTLQFDKPGVYNLTLDEYTVGAATFRGGYADDPDGFATETKLSATSASISVSQRMTADVVIGAERCTLAVYVNGANIVATTQDVHGEATPKLDPLTPRMRTVAETTAVKTSLAALVGSAATVSGTMATVLDKLVDLVNNHLSIDTVHSSADTHNTISTSFKGAATVEAWTTTVSKIAQNVKRHMTNDNGGGAGSAAYHVVTGAATGDWRVPAVMGGSDALQCGITAAAVWHSLNAHVYDTTLHSGATSLAPTALPALLELYRSIITVLATYSPTAPATDNSATTVLVHRAGFK
jgi:hypothetical protein